MGRWRLPAEVVEEVATDIRRLARLLWTLHLNFEQVRSWLPGLAGRLAAGRPELNLMQTCTLCVFDSKGYWWRRGRLCRASWLPPANLAF
jgi:hypothetical protein